MSIGSSMNAGVSGLQANGNKLATIADNIANSETYGYKRSDVEFSSMTISQDGASAAAGGGKLVSAGGVTTNAIWDVDAKGALESTANSTDIAVSGRGMLPVMNLTDVDDTDPAIMLTTTGGFALNADGYLTTSTGLVLTGWSADKDGNIPPQARYSTEGLDPVYVNIADVSAVPTDEITLGVNLPATETGFGESGDPLPVTMEYFDNIGASQNLTITYTPVLPALATDPDTNQWTMEITDQESGQSAGIWDIEFSDAAATPGQLSSVVLNTAGTAPLSTAYDGNTGIMTLDLGDQVIEMNMGSTLPDGVQYMSQLSSSFSPQGATANGNAAGTFAALEVDQAGMLSAIYSSGFTQVLYQIPLADVPNVDGLNVLSNQTFSVTNASGAVYLWDAGAGPTGTVEGYAREQSTTDIANELTQMIRTQRAYSSNAKIIQTVDEMLQETTNLKR